jgi:hypothetical protein
MTAYAVTPAKSLPPAKAGAGAQPKWHIASSALGSRLRGNDDWGHP